MFLRTRHLACLLLLVSSLGATQSARAETAGFRGNYIDVLLFRHAAANTLAQAAESARVRAGKPAATAALPQPSRQAVRTAWTMRPAAAHAAAIRAVSAFPRA